MDNALRDCHQGVGLLGAAFNLQTQLETAKAEVQKPFPREENLRPKRARLEELNTLLNLDHKEPEIARRRAGRGSKKAAGAPQTAGGAVKPIENGGNYGLSGKSHWFYIEPQHKFKKLIQAYESYGETGYYEVAAEPCSLLFEAALLRYSAGKKLLWVCGDRGFHCAAGVFGGELKCSGRLRA